MISRSTQQLFKQILEDSVAEKDLENAIVKKLLAAGKNPAALVNLEITSSTSDAKSIADLCLDNPFDIFQDTSDWNPHPQLMSEIIGGMRLDIVLRSRNSEKNRIIIEVKETMPLGYGVHDSQVIRYFLHLLAMSSSTVGLDIRRAVLLAAPNRWFEENTGDAWKYFLNRYTDLARAFDITLGELRIA